MYTDGEKLCFHLPKLNERLLLLIVVIAMTVFIFQLNNDQIPDFICGYLNYDQNVLTPPSRSSNKMLPLLIHVYVGPWLCSADHFHVCVCVKPT